MREKSYVKTFFLLDKKHNVIAVSDTYRIRYRIIKFM